jgi:hypothetical protein
MGLPVQIAIKVVLEPATGDGLVGASEHDTSVDDPAPCQARLRPAGALLVEPFVAVTR